MGRSYVRRAGNLQFTMCLVHRIFDGACCAYSEYVTDFANGAYRAQRHSDISLVKQPPTQQPLQAMACIAADEMCVVPD